VARAGELEVTTRALPQGGTVVSVDGELDMATTPDFEGIVGGVEAGNRLVIDLSECTFLDSSAVRVLMSIARGAEASGGSVAIVAPEPGILRVLEIAAVDTVLPVHETLDSAL
jgi:anti-sigma B factor antagonist